MVSYFLFVWVLCDYVARPLSAYIKNFDYCRVECARLNFGTLKMYFFFLVNINLDFVEKYTQFH